MNSKKQDKNVPLSTSDVFNPGQFPTHTYRPRTTEENAVDKWWRDRGKILVVNGPSKTGKTVLVQKLLSQYQPIWIDGHGLNSTEVLWSRVADSLGLFTSVERGTTDSDERATNLDIQAGFMDSHIGTNPTYTKGVEKDLRFSVDRPVELVARDALMASERPLVIDDIHFVPRDIQEQIVMALKPIVSGSKDIPGRRVAFISIGNRVMNVITNLVDMRGRMEPLDVEYWSPTELATIAVDGFSKLHLVDEGKEMATKLASQSFGSPQIMQQLCRELCEAEPNLVFDASPKLRTLEAPESWDKFFQLQLLSDISGWVTKLAKGPERRGKERKPVPLKDGRIVDGYQLILVAAASTGPILKLTKEELGLAIRNVVDIVPAPKSVPTATLKNMSLIAATKLLDKIPSLQALQPAIDDGFDPYAQADLQPVLEYVDLGNTSTFEITDPFFAFYLAWGLDDVLKTINAPQVEATDDGETERKTEEDEWGDSA